MKRSLLQRRINEEVFDILIEDRMVILNMIASEAGKDVIYQEGTGTRIAYSRLQTGLLNRIYDFIQEAKKKTYLNLDSDSD